MIPLAVRRHARLIDLGGEIHIAVDLPGLLADLEGAAIEMALARTRGDRKAAAELLGLKRTTLVEKLKRMQKARVQARVEICSVPGCGEKEPKP
jgi:DNA-binding NtrC family response regulator